MASRGRKRGGLLKMSGGWRSTRKSGNLWGDVALPALMIVLGLITVGMIVFTAGVLLQIIPYS